MKQRQLGAHARRSRETARKSQILQPPYNSSDPFRYRILTCVQLSHRPQLLVSLLQEPIAGGEMSTIPAKTIERNRHNPDGRNHRRAHRQTTPMTAKTSTASPWEAAHESQTLRAVSLCAARLGRPLRSRSHASRVREVRRRARDAYQPLPTRDLQETKMRNSPQYLQHDAAKRCAVCDGKFGLIRHYSWRTALCSKKCADRLKARQEGDSRWLRRPQAA
jgi:hypothetical protein